MSRRGGFMGAIALSKALIIAQWTSDCWPPKRNNYTIRCPSRPFCPTPLRPIDIDKDGWHVCMSSHCTKIKTLMPQTWTLPSCVQDIIWRRTMPNLADKKVAVLSCPYSSLIGSITRLSCKKENSSTRAYMNVKRTTLNINCLWNGNGLICCTLVEEGLTATGFSMDT